MSPATISENTYFLVWYHTLIFDFLYVPNTILSLYVLSAEKGHQKAWKKQMDIWLLQLSFSQVRSRSLSLGVLADT